MRKTGPYLRKDGRYHMVVTRDDGTKTTQSYPRHLMELRLGRLLEEWEHVDHIDNDKTNNDIDNLQILTLKENSQKAAALNPRQVYTFTCPCCGKESTKMMNQVKHNLQRGRKGPFCSRVCAGKYTYQNPWSKK